MKKKVLIIGGGIAGLNAALYLDKTKYNVSIIEANKYLGGRLSSKLIGKVEFDNGQHLILGVYTHFLNFLDKIAYSNLLRINNINIPYYDIHDGYGLLKSNVNIPKLGLLFAILSFKLLTTKSKIRIFYLSSKILLNKPFDHYKNVLDLLYSENQTSEAIKKLWEPIVVATQNTPIEIASVDVFLNVIKLGFLGGKGCSDFIFPRDNFSKILQHFEVEAKKNNIKLIKNSRIKEIVISKNRVAKVYSNKSEEYAFDYFVFAIPPWSLKKIKNSALINDNLSKFEYSSITSIYFSTDKVLIKELYCTFTNYNIQWLFNRSLITGDNESNNYQITISYPKNIIKLSKVELIDLIKNELELSLKINFNIINFKIVTETKATFLSSNLIESYRPQIKTKLENVFLIGDWVDNGLPSTLEGAAKSGKELAEVLNNL